jgi:pimeloyl-ACP methyl ester carboxylesterase
MTSRRVLLTFGMLLISFTTARGQAPQHAANAPDARIPLPRVTDWFLSTGNWQNDPQLYVREFGRGSDPVIMLHGGWGAEHSGLLEAVRTLEDRYRFIFYDQRGSLRSPSPDSLITFDRHIEDLELLRKELQQDTLTLVGHSMGAILASAYASKYPLRIKQLILLAPPHLRNPLPDADRVLLDQQSASLETFLNRREVAQELNRYGLDRTDRPLTSQEETAKFRINLYKRMLYDVSHWPRLTGGRALYKGHVAELTSKTYPPSGWDYIQEFTRRTYPVGIIVGDHDFLDFGNGLTKKWTRHIPHIELTIVKNAGHLLWVDQADVLAAELSRHLERRPPRSPTSMAR